MELQFGQRRSGVTRCGVLLCVGGCGLRLVLRLGGDLGLRRLHRLRLRRGLGVRWLGGLLVSRLSRWLLVGRLLPGRLGGVGWLGLVGLLRLLGRGIRLSGLGRLLGRRLAGVSLLLIGHLLLLGLLVRGLGGRRLVRLLGGSLLILVSLLCRLLILLAFVAVPLVVLLHPIHLAPALRTRAHLSSPSLQ